MQLRSYYFSRYHWNEKMRTEERPEHFIPRGFFFEKHFGNGVTWSMFRYDSNVRANKALYSLIVFKPEED